MVKVDFHPRLLLAYSEIADGNMDLRFSDPPQVKKNRQAFFSQFKINPSQIIEGEQVHFSRILTLHKDNAKMWHGQKITGVDGFITREDSIALALRVADCVPLVMYDPAHHALAVLHAGFKGISHGIHLQGLERLEAEYQSHPKEVLIWIGPAARECCYLRPLTDPVLNQTEWKSYRKKTKLGYKVDMVSKIIDDLHYEGGVLKKNLFDKHICTIDHPNLFSHQQAVTSGTPEGRFLILIRLR